MLESPSCSRAVILLEIVGLSWALAVSGVHVAQEKKDIFLETLVAFFYNIYNKWGDVVTPLIEIPWITSFSRGFPVLDTQCLRKTDNITWLLRHLCVTHWKVSVPRCTNKWSTPNKRDNHRGRRTSISIKKSTYTTTTIFPRSDICQKRSHSAEPSPPHEGAQNMGMMAASSNFNSSD
jgi:hypothetical protein